MIDGMSFFGRYSHKARFGDILESFVFAALKEALPADNGWEYKRWFREQVEGYSNDEFDFLVGNLTTGASLLVQVTHYNESANVAPEPNRTYEVYETLEEFTHAKAMALLRLTDWVTPDTSTVNILFGNKNYAYPWVTPFEDTVYDLTIYPHYYLGTGRFIDLQIYPELSRYMTDFNAQVDDGIPIDEFEVFRSDYESGRMVPNLSMAFEAIRDQISAFVSNGCPKSSVGSQLWQTRADFLQSPKYQTNLSWLNEQIDQGGRARPSIRQLVADFEREIPTDRAEAADLAALREKYFADNQALLIGLRALSNFARYVTDIADDMARDIRETILELWDESDPDQRNWNRLFLRLACHLVADDLYGDGVTEQNLYVTVFPPEQTDRIVGTLSQSLDRRAGIWEGLSEEALRRSYRDVLLATKEEVANLLKRKRTGTRLVPVNDYLGILLDRESIPYTRNAVETTFADRILNITSEVRFPFLIAGQILLKSKYTKTEDGRRSKEEGSKSWAVLLDRDLTLRNLEMWILVDGRWSLTALKRLVECGWRVYLDAGNLVADLRNAVTS